MHTLSDAYPPSGEIQRQNFSEIQNANLGVLLPADHLPLLLFTLYIVDNLRHTLSLQLVNQVRIIFKIPIRSIRRMNQSY